MSFTQLYPHEMGHVFFHLLSPEDSICAISLNKDGILYLSFVEGDYDHSGFISGSSGDRTYFYYHDLKTIEQAIALNNMVIVDRQIVAYKKADDSIEEHTIVFAQKCQPNPS